MILRILFLLTIVSIAATAFAEEYHPKLFASIKPVYTTDFSDGKFDETHWQKRQGTTWEVQDGVLVGTPSPKEFQEKKIAANDKAHAGFKPVVWLEKVPENLVVQFRLRFDAEDYHPKYPLIDIGHHVNTLTFGENATTLTLKKNQKVITVEETFLPLNQWVEVTLELKPGSLYVKMNDREKLFEDPLIDMIGQQQIDFKGVDHGEIRIDDLKVWEGVE